MLITCVQVKNALTLLIGRLKVLMVMTMMLTAVGGKAAVCARSFPSLSVCESQ